MDNLENKASSEREKIKSVHGKEGYICKVAEKMLKIRKTISDSQPDWYKATYGIFKF